MSRTRSVTRLIAIGLLSTIIGLSIFCLAAVRRYSEAEKECAETIGVNLRGPGYPTDPNYERRLAWLSEVVLSGTVAEIQHDIRGTYPTIVTVSVTSVFKGDLPIDSNISVCLFSGPTYSPQKGDIVPTKLCGEPNFAVGENVLLFLHSSYPEPAEDPDRYALPPEHYLLVRKAKWLVEGTTAIQVGISGHSHPMDWIESEIELAVQTQLANCE